MKLRNLRFVTAVFAMLLLSSVCSSQTMPDWMQIKNKPFIELEAFGVVGDGTADDTASMTLAIKDALDKGYDISFNSAKTYYITDRVIFTNTAGDLGDEYDITIHGNGATLQCGKDATESDAGFSVTPSAKVTFNNLIFNGYRTLLAAEAYGLTGGDAPVSAIQPTSPNNVVISTSARLANKVSFNTCIFTNIFGDAIHLSQSGPSTIFLSRCMFENIAWNCVYSLDVIGSSTLTVRNCDVKDVGLLPDDFTVGGVASTFDGSVYQIQTSYGFLGIGGAVEISDTNFENYTTGAVVTVGFVASAFIESTLVARGNTFSCNSEYCRSANPNAAIWTEQSRTLIATDNTINCKLRNASDTLENSAAIAVLIQPGGYSTVNNNIIKIESSSTQYGIREFNTASSTHHMDHNLIGGPSVEAINSNATVATQSASVVTMIGNITSAPLSMNFVSQSLMSMNFSPRASEVIGSDANPQQYINSQGEEALASPTSTATSYASIVLPPGIWLVSGNLRFLPSTGAATPLTVSLLVTDTANVVLPSNLTGANEQLSGYLEVPLSKTGIVTFSGIVDQNSAANATLYLNALVTLSTGDVGVKASISASRLH